jgi:hypothetical protein
MYRNTLDTLRQVENFLKIPCFDFSSIATIPPNNSTGPPQRKPTRVKDKVLVDFKHMSCLFLLSRMK